jgi:hypothetical protein
MAKKIPRFVAHPPAIVLPIPFHSGAGPDALPCTGRTQEKSGTEQWTLHTFMHVDGLRVVVISQALGLGLTVPVKLVSTSTGFTFLGNTCVQTAGDHCTDGTLQTTVTAAKGTIKGEKIAYEYTLEVYCGDVLSCVENGTCSGARSSGIANAAEGSWFCTQTWSVTCCPAKQRTDRVRLAGRRPARKVR